MVTRDEALHKLVSLRNLYEHPNTNEHEAATARAMAAKLRAKFDIPESERPKPPPNDDFLRDTWNWFSQAAAQQRRAEDLRRQREAREKAQREWEARMADKDAMGQPLTDAERREAQRDPLGWASKRDQRTSQQRQQDMQNSFGSSQRVGYARRANQRPVCNPKLPFYDDGGEPRLRNLVTLECELCGRTLHRGEAARYKIGFACCDTVPGPRNKRSDRE